MRALDIVCAALALAAGAALFGLIGLTFVDVILRYLFDAPILGGKDLLEMGMVLVISLAFPFTWRVGGHIVVDLIPDYGARALTVSRDLAVRLIAIAIFVLLAWRAWVEGDDAELFNRATNMIEIPFRPFYWVLAAAAGFQSLVLAVECARLATGRTIGLTLAWAAQGHDAAPAG